MPPRIGPRPLTPAERQARQREARKAYVAALERLAGDAEDYLPTRLRQQHAETIHRARAAQTQHGGE